MSTYPSVDSDYPQATREMTVAEKGQSLAEAVQNLAIALERKREADGAHLAAEVRYRETLATFDKEAAK